MTPIENIEISTLFIYKCSKYINVNSQSNHEKLVSVICTFLDYSPFTSNVHGPLYSRITPDCYFRIVQCSNAGLESQHEKYDHHRTLENVNNFVYDSSPVTASISVD